MPDLDLRTTATIPSGAGVAVTVLEDVGNTGTFDNEETTVISDGTNTVTLTTLDGSEGNRYDLYVEFTPGSAASLSSAQIEQAKGGANTIAGVVEDADNNRIQGATIELINQTDGTVQSTTTNSNGFYEFTELAATDTYHVVARYEAGGDDFRAEAYPYVNVTGDNVVTAQAVAMSRRQNGIGAKRIQNVANVRTYEAQAYDRRRGGLHKQ